MSKTIYLHLFVALLVLDWSHAFTSRLLEEHERHIPEKHHASRRHASRRNNRYLDGDLKAEPSSTVHRYVRKEPVSDMIQDNIQEVFNFEENSEGKSQVVKRESSGPTFHQSNAVPGSFITNHFHQYPGNQQPQQYPAYQQPQQPQQYPVYQPQQIQQLPYYPYGFGLAPIIICLCCNQPTTVPQTNANSNNGSSVSVGNRIDGDEDNSYDQYYNTATGISLQKIPPKRNDSRVPPPIAHGVESNNIVPPNFPFTTARPIFELPSTPNRPVNQRPQRPPNQPNQNQRPSAQRPIQRPVTQRPITQRPPEPSNSQGKADRTNCAIAILQCCSNGGYTDRCFSTRGCPGPFFDNPCTSDLAQEANKFLTSDSVLFFN